MTKSIEYEFRVIYAEKQTWLNMKDFSNLKMMVPVKAKLKTKCEYCGLTKNHKTKTVEIAGHHE